MRDDGATTPMPDWQRPGARCSMSVESATSMHASSFGWDYEIQVALPASYGVTGDQRYRVLWITDGPMLFNLAVGISTPSS